MGEGKRIGKAEREKERKVVGEGERVPYSGTLSRENEIFMNFAIL